MARRTTWERMLRSPGLVVSACFILLIWLAALLAPWLAPHDPLKGYYANILEGPSRQFLLGTDELGRDIFSRLLYGARPSSLVAIGAVVVESVVGVTAGVVAGYARGHTEALIMRTVDVLLCFPATVVALTVSAALGASLTNLVLVIGLLYSLPMVRLAHGITLSLGHAQYVEAARANGATSWRIIRRDILPNMLAPLMVQLSLDMGWAMLTEAGLSFLGLGVMPPNPSWGGMAGRARGYMTSNPNYVLWPALLLALMILAFNTMGDRLRDILDPKLRR